MVALGASVQPRLGRLAPAKPLARLLVLPRITKRKVAGMGVPGRGGRPLRVEDTVLTYDASCGWGYICPICNMYVDNPQWKGNKGANLALISYRTHKEMCDSA